MIPSDPIMLLSYLNLKLRDEYDDLESLCSGLDISRQEIEEKLKSVGYRYNKDTNQFK